ncbi:MAG: cytidine deaminase [Oscillospiraceae bacterium]
MEYEVLINNALEVRKLAYVPYSKFSVGASLITKDGKIFNGCNVENVSYPLGMCAERTAIFKAISEGYRDFSAICVVGGLNENLTEYCYPCGACLQVLNEFCTQDFKIILFNGKDVKSYTLKELSPYGFTELK